MLLLLLGCALGTLATKGASAPPAHGSLTVDGLHGPVRILRDGLGVPHIRAEDEHDLWFSIGFVHAQDRLFQMDLVRRIGAGRVAAWLGPDFVPFDTFMSGLEMDRRYQERMPGLDPALLQVGQAYADGVNAGAASLPELPVEYRLLGVDFEPWRIQDAMSASVINSWTLGENAPKEAISLMLRDKLDAQTADALWRWDEDSPPIDPYWDTLRQQDIAPFNPEFRGLVELLWGVHVPTNSNNWAVDGTRSASGAPILANDPHLPQMAPSVWYVVEGQGGDVHIAGASLAGTPFLASGHNEHVAWGVTNVMADYVDLAVLERVGESGYLLGGEARQLREVQVDIPVKDHPEARGSLFWTEVGPVISTLDGSHIVALRWHLFEVEDGTAAMWYDIQRAASVDQVLQAEQRPSMIAQNLVSADVYGNIAWQPFGSVPQRQGWTGRLPYPASEPGMDWVGWVDMPGQLNPDSGRVATANARPEHPDPYAISTAFLPSYRQDRILQLLDASDAHTPQSFAAIQQDERDDHALERIPELLGGASLNRCGEVLRDFDGQSDVGSSGALVWAVFQEELIRLAITDELGEWGTDLYLAAAISGRSVLDGGWEHFVDDRDEAVEEALRRTCDTLGAEPWRWGEHHTLHIPHLFAEQSPLLAGWSMPAAPWGGSHHTVNQSGYSFFEPDLRATWIASLRVITPLEDVGAATFSYPGGQSGQPGHDHYRDLFAPFVAGEMLPLWFWDEDVGEHAVDTLVLRPG